MSSPVWRWALPAGLPPGSWRILPEKWKLHVSAIRWILYLRTGCPFGIGLSLWYKERLTGNYEITYRVQVVVENGSYDRLSDLNCFWGADDPRHPDDFFARSAWRNGEFKNYNTLDLYYVGYGGNDNGTTRFREYHGEYYGVDDAKIKPILKEYTDAAHLLKPNHWYEVKIRVENGATTYAMDGEELFSLPVADGKGDGYFALRLWQNHVRFADFQVANIDNLK